MIRLYIILLACGALLLGAEVFVPGGILGILGGAALLAAVVIGFGFGWVNGLISAIGIIGLTALAIFLWIRIFPQTAPGRKLTLNRNGRDFKLDDTDRRALIGQEGMALSPLRPSGVGLVEGRRRDVITQGIWLDAGRRFRVTGVEGVWLIVEPVEEPPTRSNVP